MSDDLIRTWAPDDFWQAAQPLIPIPVARPQGGGKRRADDRAGLAAIVYLVRVRLWERLHQQFLHRLNVVSEIDWSRAVVDSIAVRATKRGKPPGQTRSTAANPAQRSTSCATGGASP